MSLERKNLWSLGWHRVSLLILVIASGFLPDAAAQSDQVGGVQVTIGDAWPALVDRNFSHVRTEVENLTGSATRVRLRLATYSYEVDPGEQVVSVELEPGESRVLDWVVPVWLGSATGRLWFDVPGASRRGDLSFETRLPALSGGIDADHSIVVVSTGIVDPGYESVQSARFSNVAIEDSAEFRTPAPLTIASEFEWSRMKTSFSDAGISTDTSGLQGRPGAVTGTYAVRLRAPRALPTALEPYSGISALVLDTRALPLPGSLFRRLEDWVLAGGTLVLSGEAEAAARASTHLEQALDSRNHLVTFDQTQVLRCGFGQLVLTETTADPLAEGTGQARALWWVFERLPSFLGRGPRGKGAWRLFHPTIGDLRQQPHRPLAITLVGIVLLLGPGVMWFVRRRRQPVLLLIVLPVAGLLLTSAVGSYGVFRHGISVRESVISLTLLNQEAGLMQNFASRQLYSGLATSQAVRPSTSTLVLPRLFRERKGFMGGRMPGTFRFSNSGGRREFRGSYLPARRPVRYDAVSVRLDRQRLEIESAESGAPQAISGFETDLAQLIVRDAQGDYWSTQGSLSPGSREVLRPSGRQDAQALLKRITPGVGMPGMDELEPGSYAATLEDGVFVDDLDLRTRRIQEFHGLIGQFGGAVGGSQGGVR